MSLKEDIDNLSLSSNPLAQSLGSKLKNINDALEAKEITADEAKDLINDINIDSEIIKLANDLESKILLQKAIDSFISLIGNLSKI